MLAANTNQHAAYLTNSNTPSVTIKEAAPLPPSPPPLDVPSIEARSYPVANAMSDSLARSTGKSLSSNPSNGSALGGFPIGELGAVSSSATRTIISKSTSPQNKNKITADRNHLEPSSNENEGYASSNNRAATNHETPTKNKEISENQTTSNDRENGIKMTIL